MRALGVMWLVVVSLAACSASRVEQAPQPRATGTETATPSLDSTASVPPPPVPPPAEPIALPLKEGYFTCGAEQCKSHTETCCAQESTCVPRGKETLDDCYTRSECDVSTDCLDGQRCCIHSYAMEKPYYEQRCQAQCREAESCRDGTCPAGQVCWGVCANPKVDVLCGSAVCSGEQPWCSWNAEAKTGQCAGPGDAAAQGAFRCDEDGDCLAKERCWLGIIGSWCCRGDSCYDHAATTKFVACKTKRDCPKLEGMRFDCIPDADLPPHIGRHCEPIHEPPQ